VRELVALLAENLEQVVCFFVAGAFKVVAKAAGLAAQGEVGGWRSPCRCGFGTNEFALDVDIADLAGSLAKLLEQAERFMLLLLVRRESGEHGEQGELSCDAAGRRAQPMDSFRSGVHQAGEHCGLERFRQFAEGLYGAR
jgi:hypothetical protein